jgi:hypothetical protein
MALGLGGKVKTSILEFPISYLKIINEIIACG